MPTGKDRDSIVAIEIGAGARRVAVLGQVHAEELNGGVLARNLVERLIEPGALPEGLTVCVYPRVNPTGHRLGIRRNGLVVKPPGDHFAGFTTERDPENPTMFDAWGQNPTNPADVGFNLTACWSRDSAPETVAVRQDLDAFMPHFAFDLHGARLDKPVASDGDQTLLGLIWLTSSSEKSRLERAIVKNSDVATRADKLRRLSELSIPPQHIVEHSQRMAASIAESVPREIAAFPRSIFTGLGPYLAASGIPSLIIELGYGTETPVTTEVPRAAWLEPTLTQIARGTIEEIDPRQALDISVLRYPILPHRPMSAMDRARMAGARHSR
ncbi:MAG: hypothetical protein HOQ05_07105 [Corynebacteriales bacterium]|nr:hypothetical protein [Mycobacteriales bacterium]